jgi:hypothetical protein
MLKKLTRDRQTMMSIGMIALILANISHFLIHPAGHSAQEFSDGFYGVLIGISIGCNLLSLRRHDRQSA